MNAHTPTVAPEALALAATNAAILRAIGDAGYLIGQAEVAKRAGVSTKNIGRTLQTLQREGLVSRDASDGAYKLTSAGWSARHAVDVAAGEIAPGGAEPPADTEADPAAPIVWLTHEQIRPNPLQPRKIDLEDAEQRRKLDELKASIVAADRVLQNLVVFPADAEGVHVLSAGERRWRAVGELIEEGMWPASRRLPAQVVENTAGQAAFIGLVENGQRANLTLIEEARAYEALCRETGWSARKAALQTGRDERTVQEMLKVLREADPDAIAAHERGDEGCTWEWLRDSVKKPREAEEEDVQGDLKDVTPAIGSDGMDLPAGARRALREIAARSLHRHRLLDDWVIAHPSMRDDPDFQTLDCLALVTHRERDDGQLDVALSLRGRDFLRSAGIAPEDGKSANSCATPWLRERGLADFGEALDAMAERARAGELLDASSLGAGSLAPGKPAADHLARQLSRRELLALAEIAHAPREHGHWVRVRNYWLDQTASDLVAGGLVAFNHSLANGPHVQLTSEARIRLKDAGIDAGAVLDGDLDRLRAAVGQAGWPASEGYVTPWLNGTDQAQAENSPPAGDSGDAGDASDRQQSVEDEAAAAAAQLLAKVRETLARNHTAAEIRELLGLAGLRRPFGTSDHAEETGVVFDADGDDAAVADVHGQLPNDLAQARAELIAYALNFATCDGREREGLATSGPQPLLALYPGDLVSIGGEATAYRLIREVGGGRSPTFLAQAVSLKNGKNYGSPRHVTLHAIQRVVRRAADQGDVR